MITDGLPPPGEKREGVFLRGWVRLHVVWFLSHEFFRKCCRSRLSDSPELLLLSSLLICTLFVNWSLKTCTRNYVGWAWSCVVFHSRLLNTEILPLTRTGKDLGRLALAGNLSCRKWVLDPLWGPTFNQQGFGRLLINYVSSSLSPKLLRKVELSWLLAYLYNAWGDQTCRKTFRFFVFNLYVQFATQ